MTDTLANATRIRSTRMQTSAVAKLALLSLLVVTCLGLVGFQAATTPVGLQQFVGSWQAQFRGKTFLTLSLRKEQGKLTGTASHADIDLDKTGNLTSAEARDGSDPVVEAKLTNGILRITTKEEDSQDTNQFEMKLIGKDEAELRIITPPNITAPKPWKAERAK